MAHLIDRHLIERANAAVLLSMVWAALAGSAPSSTTSLPGLAASCPPPHAA